MSDPSLIVTRLVTITPAMAAEWLKCNTNNRPLKMQVVESYRRDMLAGAYRVTHQGIAFDRHGVLLDGQHRLRAIVAAGIAVTMLVTTGLEPEARLVVDTHAKRQTLDCIAISTGDVLDATAVASVKLLCNYGVTRAKTVTNSDIFNEYQKMLDAIRFVAPLQKCNNAGRGVSTAPVIAAVICAWFYVHDLKRLALFMDQLRGAEIGCCEEDTASTVLRNSIIGGRLLLQSQAARIVLFLKTKRAIVAFMDGQKIKRLTEDASAYPYPIDIDKAVRGVSK